MVTVLKVRDPGFHLVPSWALFLDIEVWILFRPGHYCSLHVSTFSQPFNFQDAVKSALYWHLDLHSIR
jgi:hypothetical protein